MNENEIRDVLGEGIGEEPPIVGGPAAVFAGARARVVRTRAVTGALSVVAVLGVTAGAVAIGGGVGASGGGAKADQVVAPGAVGTSSSSKAVAPTSAATTATPSPKAPAKGGQYTGAGTSKPAPVPGAGQVLIDGRSVGEIVKTLLPSGLTSANYTGQDSYRPSQFGVRATVSMSVDDGTGRLTTVVGGIDENYGVLFSQANCQTLTGFGATDCRTFPQPDGSVIITYRQDEWARGTNGPTQGSYSWDAMRAFPDGKSIAVSANNYFDPLTDRHEKGWHVSPTRPTTLLTADQLKAMLTDSRWGLVVSDQFAQQARHDLVPYKDDTQH